MKDLIVRNINTDVTAHLNQKLGGAVLGHTSPRQSYLRAGYAIMALEYDVASWTFMLWQCAMKIAAQRGEEDLRQLDAILTKQEAEAKEYAAILVENNLQQCTLVDIANRLSNVLYYNVQRFAHDTNIDRFLEQCDTACKRANIPLLVALQVAAIKYQDRASRTQKSLPDEYRKMEMVLQQFRLI